MRLTYKKAVEIHCCRACKKWQTCNIVCGCISHGYDRDFCKKASDECDWVQCGKRTVADNLTGEKFNKPPALATIREIQKVKGEEG